MSYVTTDEINTHLYGEVTTEINRDDATRLDKAIAAAQAQAYGYLTAYDTTAIFAATGDDRNPILVLFIKDIAVWHYIQLANPAVDMELRKTRYDDAITGLKDIQRGASNPMLPLPAPVDGVPDENFFRYGSNTKLTYNF